MNKIIEQFMKRARRWPDTPGADIQSVLRHGGMAYANIGTTMLWLIDDYPDELGDTWTDGQPVVCGVPLYYEHYQKQIQRTLLATDRDPVSLSEMARVGAIKIQGAKDNKIAVNAQNGSVLVFRKPIIQDFQEYTRNLDMEFYLIPSLRRIYAENLMGEGAICCALEPRDSITREENSDA